MYYLQKPTENYCSPKKLRVSKNLSFCSQTMTRQRKPVNRYDNGSSSTAPTHKKSVNKSTGKTNQQNKKPSPVATVFAQLVNEIGKTEGSDFTIPEEMIIHELSGPYKELDANNYRGKSACRRGIDDDDEAQLCACTPETGCLPDKCQNRLMMMYGSYPFIPSILHLINIAYHGSCHELFCRECPLGSCPSQSALNYCANTIIQRKAFPRTEVFYAQSCGLGLRLLEDVPRNAIIIEYLGDVITPEECEERMARYEMKDNFYFASLGDGLLLDAKPAGSRARFANHSCDPTCQLQKWTVLGEPRICIVSKRALTAGTEVTYNYQYFNDGMENGHSSGSGKRRKVNFKRQPCHCGAKNCAGTIGGKATAVDSDDEDAWTRKAESMVSGRRRFTIEEVEAHISEYTGPVVDESDLIQPPIKSETGPNDASQDSCIGDFDKEDDKNSDDMNQSDVTLGPRELCLALHRLANRMNNWLQSNQSRLRSLFHQSELISSADADAILRRMPRAMKSHESTELDGALKRALKTERTVRLLLAMPSAPAVTSDQQVPADNESLNQSNTVEKSDFIEEYPVSSPLSLPPSVLPTPTSAREIESSNSQPNQRGAVPRIEWGDLMATLRDINQSLPVIVPCAEGFIPHLRALAQWSRSILAKSPASPASLASLQRAVESDSGHWRTMKKYLVAYLPTIAPVSSSSCNNNNNNGDESRVDADLSIYLDIFVLAGYLEGKLEDYINKKNKSQLTQPCGGFGDKVDSTDPTARPLSNSKNARAAVVDEESDLVHCFCQVPENCGEIVTMKQCDGCDRWFHPNCVNDPPAHSTKPRLKDDTFFCPLCLLQAGRLGPFAFAPQSEWKISLRDVQVYKKQPRASKPMKGKSKSKGKGKGRVHKKAGNTLKPKVKAISSDQAPVSTELQRLRTRANVGSKQGATAESSSAAVHRSRPPFRLQDIESATRTEKHLVICRVSVVSLCLTLCFYLVSNSNFTALYSIQSPPALFLSLYADYVRSWQRETALFLESDEVAQLTEAPVQQVGSKSVPLIGDALTAALDKCLCLYFDLRLLGVRPLEVNTLRQVAWTISIQSLLANDASLNNGSGSSSSSGDNVSNGRIDRVVPTIDDAISVITAARGLAVSFQSPPVLAIESLLIQATTLLHSLRAATIADSFSSLDQVQNTLTSVESRLRISHCYPVVRFRSILLLQEKYCNETSRSKLSISVHDKLQAALGDPVAVCGARQTLSERYCVCRSGGEDDGRAMIECSGCFEWFHYACVRFDPVRAKRAQRRVEGADIDTKPHDDEDGVSEADIAVPSNESTCEPAVHTSIEVVERGQHLSHAIDESLPHPVLTSIDPLTHAEKKQGQRKIKIEVSGPEPDIDDIEYFCIPCSELLGTVYGYEWKDTCVN